jgi:transposase
MENTQHRHEISDGAWERLKPLLPGQRGQREGIAKDNRRFINAVYQCFRCQRDKGIWETILTALIDDPDYEWLMVDASQCKVHPHAARARGGNQDTSRTKGDSIPGLTLPWIRLVCRLEHVSQKTPELIVRKLSILFQE